MTTHEFVRTKLEPLMENFRSRKVQSGWLPFYETIKLIEEHFIPIPRCETCKHSHFTDTWDENGSCEELHMWIAKDFGCVQWKGKA